MIASPTGEPMETRSAIYPPIPKRSSGSKAGDGDFGLIYDNTQKYEAAVKAFNKQVLEHYQTQAIGRKSTLVFCAGIGLVEDLASQFKDAGIMTEALSSVTPPDERARIVRAFRNGEFPVLINCMMLIEGYDAPQVSYCVRYIRQLIDQIDCIILVRPTESIILHNQMVSMVIARLMANWVVLTHRLEGGPDFRPPPAR